MEHREESSSILDEELCSEYIGQSEVSPEIYELFHKNMKLAGYVAKKYSCPYDPAITFDDILQQGYLGLWIACLNFDETKGFKFSTYAISIIQSQILLFLRNNGQIKVPRSFKDIRFALTKHGFTLPLTEQEMEVLLEEGKFSRGQLLSYTDITMVSLDYEVTNHSKSDSEGTKAEELIEDISARIEYQFTEDDIEKIIDKILIYIKPEHRLLVEEWMYSTLAGCWVKQEDLAKKYNISQPTVGRILRAATGIVRDHREEILSLFGM